MMSTVEIIDTLITFNLFVIPIVLYAKHNFETLIILLIL